jgi:hypothetical protein
MCLAEHPAQSNLNPNYGGIFSRAAPASTLITLAVDLLFGRTMTKRQSNAGPEAAP